MPHPVQAVYVLVYHGSGRYPAMAWISASALRRVHPGARLVLITDEESPAHLRRAYPQLLALFDQQLSISATIPKLVERSYYLKTRVHDLVRGDYVFLDSDTLPIRPFAHVFAWDWDIALVQDRNHYCPIKPIYPHWEQPRMDRLGWNIVLPKYFNSGIGFYRDNSAVRKVVADWQKRWQESYATGDEAWRSLDQLHLNCALQTHPCKVHELPPAYNAMVLVHPVHARTAKIYHFFAANQQAWKRTLFEHLLDYLYQHGEMDWAALDHCVAMDHPWMPPYWAWQLWHSGSRARAVALFLRRVAAKLGRPVQLR